MTTARRVVLAAALFASGCEGEDEDVPALPVDVAKPPDRGHTGTDDDREPRPALTLDNGFVPDPRVLDGVAHGTTDASTLSGDCAGFVDTDGGHVLETLGTFAELRILAHSEQDITLVVARPDGTHLCDDDTEGTDPVVATTFSPGVYRIWVGAPAQGAEVSYRLGFSELADVTAASLSR